MIGLRHEACIYDGTDQFLRMTVPWIQEGLQAGDPIIAVAHRKNADALREALGADAGQIEIHNSESWYVSPAKSLKGFITFAAAYPNAQCVRLVGEPVWPLGWETAVREFAHYEAAFNVIAQDSPIWALCTYDANVLPDRVLDHAYSTHPHVRTEALAATNDRFVEPDEYCAQLADSMSEPVEATDVDVTADLRALCETVTEWAMAASVAPNRIGSLRLAVHELAMNALAHGDGPASARTWVTPAAFVFELTSLGTALSETTAGYVPVDPAADRGRGLWLVRQLCDFVEVRSRRGRTVIRIHMRRDT